MSDIAATMARPAAFAALGRRLRLIAEHKLVLPALKLRKRLAAARGRGERPGEIMVNIGGGYFVRPGWKTLDRHSASYPYHRSYLDYDFDLTSGRPLPFADESVRFFYSQHTLEHIPDEHCAHLFAEFRRCLKPGGALRISVPDFDKAYAAYRQGRAEFFAQYRATGREPIEENFLCMFATALVGRIAPEEVRTLAATLPPEDFAERLTGRVPRATQRAEPGNHINWWTFAKIERLSRAAGFREVYRSAAQRSRFAEMRADGTLFGAGRLVSLDRLQGFDTADPDLSVYAEAVK